jgi:hypothetical protein
MNAKSICEIGNLKDEQTGCAQTHPENSRHKRADLVGYKQTDVLNLKAKYLEIQGKGSVDISGFGKKSFDRLEIDFPTMLEVIAKGDIYHRGNEARIREADISVVGRRKAFVLDDISEQRIESAVHRYVEDPNLTVYLKEQKTEFPQVLGKVVISGEQIRLTYK